MYAKAQKYLSDYGIRPSLQRIVVVDYLMKNRTHPTADEIYSSLVTAVPTLSRMTVYNTVAMLAEKGAILTLDMDRGRMHYDGDTSPHAHFICTRCGAIRDFVPEGDLIGMLAATPPPGVSVTSVQLTYKGLCDECDEINETNETN